MSPITTFDKFPGVSARAPMPRTWAGKEVKSTERATHYLHLSAVPCEKCQGPVMSGWVGRRADDITSESRVHTLGAMCMVCGSRPEGASDSQVPVHLRPFEWEWTAKEPRQANETEADQLPAELSQDADTDKKFSDSEKAVRS